jgi:N-acetylornithine carbamoyltransferase
MNFYHLSDFTEKEVQALVARAGELGSGQAAANLQSSALGLFFLAPSLRTSASFQRAAAQLNMQLVQLNGGSVWGLETADGVIMDGDAAEHIKEAAAVLGTYVDALAVRAFPMRRSLVEDLSDPIMQSFMQHCSVPVINMESTRWHPCQALADRLTMEQLAVPKRGKIVLTWAWHPKPLPHAVPNSTLTMAAQRGMDVVLLHPKGFELQDDVLAEAELLAAANGGSLTITHDRASALENADVVYAKSWGSLQGWTDPQIDADLRQPLRDWCVTSEWLNGKAKFMHCLPVRRNVVVADEVLDGPHSVVIQQAANRLPAQTAILEHLLCPAHSIEASA